MNDLVFAARTLRKNAGFSVVAVVTLALGVGVNTSIFSVVKAVLLNQLPYRQPEQLVTVAESDPDTPRPETVDFTTTHDWRARSHSFEHMSLYRGWGSALNKQGEPELINGLRVNYDFFDTLGVRMQIGRTFLPEEDRPDRWHVLILSHGLWLRRFGGDPDVMGRAIRLNEASFTVVGVLPADFRPLEISDTDEPHEMFASGLRPFTTLSVPRVPASAPPGPVEARCRARRGERRTEYPHARHRARAPELLQP